MRNKKKDILIVDDSSLIINRLILILKDQNNIGSVSHTGSYAEASLFLNRSRVDIVFLDINLPDTSGIKLLGFIKVKYPQTAVIMFTNQSSAYYKNLCKKNGADYFIDKSKDFDQIAGIVNPGA
ncbi:MAG TPA: response regulator [Panacibacter sp.]|nr:response regulator [Panacibacter sp.]